MNSFILSALLTLAASAAHAGEFTYALFESSVSHVDLEECPAQVTATDVFCRATILHDGIHVYVFEKAHDMGFVDMLTFDKGSYTVGFK